MVRFLLLVTYILVSTVPLPASGSDKDRQVAERNERLRKRSEERELRANEQTTQRKDTKEKKTVKTRKDTPEKKEESNKGKKKQKTGKEVEEKKDESTEEKKGGIVITYFNIGQGNCVLMENEEKNQAVLVDCGSKESNNKVRKEVKKPQISLDRVADEIKEILDKYKHRFIFVTHADEDHYNKIASLDEDLKDIPHIISIGPETQDKQKKKSVERLLQSLQEKKIKDITQIRQPKELEETLKLGGLEDWIEAVAASASTASHSSTNADSIVINAYSGKCSALLAGDAESLIDRQIQSRKKTKALSTTVLLASHHGSATEDSNSEHWIAAAFPQAVVVSAGHNTSHRHPRCSIIERYLASPSLGEAAYHSITCGTDFLDLESLNPLDLNLDPKFTGKQAIFNTFDEGDITVELNTSRSGEDSFTLRGRTAALMKGPCQ